MDVQIQRTRRALRAVKAFQRTLRVVLATAQMRSLREFSRRVRDPRRRSLKRYPLSGLHTILPATRVAGSNAECFLGALRDTIERAKGSMRNHSGKTVNDSSDGDCSASDVSSARSVLDRAMSGVAASILCGDSARAVVDRVLSGLRETGLDRSGPWAFFGWITGREAWRVGEAIGRLYLTVHRVCLFPWPAEWDPRRGIASSAGPDLESFHRDGSGAGCVAFGEVKTSSGPVDPPTVVRGPDGLAQQLRELRNSKDYRYAQVRYLARRADLADWFEQFESACERCMRDDLDVRLFGCLIRDVEPSESDLRRAVVKLASGHPQAIEIELLAIYLPRNRIPRLGHDLDEALSGASP